MEGFWNFSVRTYRTPGVPDACLSLQNGHGADVNMLLYCCWVGAVVGAFDGALFERARAFSAQWAEHVVIPLRAARTWMKQTGCDSDPVPTDACMELREEIKTVEFTAEKMQQEVLESFVSIDRDRNENPETLIDEVAANLVIYLDCIEVKIENDVREKLCIIISAAFPEIDKEILAKAFAA